MSCKWREPNPLRRYDRDPLWVCGAFGVKPSILTARLKGHLCGAGMERWEAVDREAADDVN